MKKKLIHITEPLMRRFGLKLLRNKDFERQCEREQLLMGLVDSWRNEADRGGGLNLEIVIFSKDRALQLHGLLSSLFHHVLGEYQISVLFCASSEAHAQAYKEVEQCFAGQWDIKWVREQNFRNDLIDLLKTSGCKEVCFLVDDIVFIRPIDFNTMNWQGLLKGVLSLRLGKEINYCYTKGREMTMPELSTFDGDGDTLEFSWDEGQDDWAYPLSVDGHIFSLHEIKCAAEALGYTAPNSFERALQRLLPLFLNRKGYCFELPRLLNIPLNKVQNENDNISADVSPEYLLGKWQEGMMLDYLKLANIKTNSVHSEVPFSYCKRLEVTKYERGVRKYTEI